MNIATLKQANARRWSRMTILPQYFQEVHATATRLIAPPAKVQYQAVEKDTGVPWAFIAVVHEREASQSWRGNLAQGDPWNQRSIHVPRGRGPFVSWVAAAIDALQSCAPYAARWPDWTAAGALTMLEEYNGLGYASMGIPSPYVWASTDQYSRGKYVADGHFDPDAVDRQLGCAALLRQMMAMDASITFATEAHDLLWVQQQLIKLGAHIDADGEDGPQTQAAVKAFQTAHGLTVDGVAGPDTVKAIEGLA